ncbi:unnamed protein product, partial [Onchocerca ochengi]|uniref:Alpha/beta hydrolase n=1 Tax=Onchocerca ochengi TaxID=42157 RepID=A0A182EUT8_ONCOC
MSSVKRIGLLPAGPLDRADGSLLFLYSGPSSSSWMEDP